MSRHAEFAPAPVAPGLSNIGSSAPAWSGPPKSTLGASKGSSSPQGVRGAPIASSASASASASGTAPASPHAAWSSGRGGVQPAPDASASVSGSSTWSAAAAPSLPPPSQKGKSPETGELAHTSAGWDGVSPTEAATSESEGMRTPRAGADLGGAATEPQQDAIPAEPGYDSGFSPSSPETSSVKPLITLATEPAEPAESEDKPSTLTRDAELVESIAGLEVGNAEGCVKSEDDGAKAAPAREDETAWLENLLGGGARGREGQGCRP